MRTPIALILFNRPNHLQKVFRAIAEARPRKLFLIADGPRAGHDEDRELCAQAREIVAAPDWPVEVHRNFSQINLGCGRRVASGLDWVFARVPEAIIVEDDCLPSPDFFPFCEELLERYRYDTRVGMISGDNFVAPAISCPDSYYFSKYAHVWGWATWRRTWQAFDFDLTKWPEAKRQNILDVVLRRPEVTRFWAQIFDSQYASHRAWAARLVFTCFMNNLLNILPAVNLVSNIGWGAGATHALDPNDPRGNIPTGRLQFPLRHPEYIVGSTEADDYTERSHFGIG